MVGRVLHIDIIYIWETLLSKVSYDTGVCTRRDRCVRGVTLYTVHNFLMHPKPHL